MNFRNFKNFKRTHLILIASIIGLGTLGTWHHFHFSKTMSFAILDSDDEDEAGSVFGIPHSGQRQAKAQPKKVDRRIASGCSETWG